MSDPKVFFGVSLELAGKTISLEPKNAIEDLKEKGIEVELPAGERVYLGTVGTSIGTIIETLGVQADFIVTEKEATDSGGTLTEGAIKSDFLPNIDVLQDAAELVLEAGLYVDEFHVRIPGAATSGTVTKEKTAYTVGLSAEWQDDAGQLIDGLDLKLKGVYFKISNEE